MDWTKFRRFRSRSAENLAWVLEYIQTPKLFEASLHLPRRAAEMMLRDHVERYIEDAGFRSFYTLNLDVGNSSTRKKKGGETSQQVRYHVRFHTDLDSRVAARVVSVSEDTIREAIGRIVTEKKSSAPGKSYIKFDFVVRERVFWKRDRRGSLYFTKSVEIFRFPRTHVYPRVSA